MSVSPRRRRRRGTMDEALNESQRESRYLPCRVVLHSIAVVHDAQVMADGPDNRCAAGMERVERRRRCCRWPGRLRWGRRGWVVSNSVPLSVSSSWRLLFSDGCSVARAVAACAASCHARLDTAALLARRAELSWVRVRGGVVHAHDLLPASAACRCTAASSSAAAGTRTGTAACSKSCNRTTATSTCTGTACTAARGVASTTASTACRRRRASCRRARWGTLRWGRGSLTQTLGTLFLPIPTPCPRLRHLHGLPAVQHKTIYGLDAVHSEAVSDNLPSKQLRAVAPLQHCVVHLQPCGIELNSSNRGQLVRRTRCHAQSEETYPLKEGHQLGFRHVVTTASVAQVARRDGDESRDISDERQRKQRPGLVGASHCAREEQLCVAVHLGNGGTPTQAEAIAQAHGPVHARSPKAEGEAIDAEGGDVGVPKQLVAGAPRASAPVASS